MPSRRLDRKNYLLIVQHIFPKTTRVRNFVMVLFGKLFTVKQMFKSNDSKIPLLLKFL